MARHCGQPLDLAQALALMLMLTLVHPAHAELVETTLQVPVQLAERDGSPVRQSMLVTLVRDSARRHAPFALLLHGRPVAAQQFARIGRQRYPANAAWLVAQGFAVLVPTRIGYGLSGGPDLEYTGECSAKDYTHGPAVVVAETRQLLAFSATLEAIDHRRGVVIGESYGGLAALAVAAERLPGVVGVVNVAGGDGGDFTHPAQPCSADRLVAAFARLGQRRGAPALWLYSANDLLWGSTLPTRWFQAWRAAGGDGQFVALPANGANGHFVFNHGASEWRPALLSFFRQLGFALHDGHS